ncbi:Flp pilus assembly protein CpaB [Sediminihabitans luteus]|uniref:Flp pilus assembly protein CpaB n=1 Tax=Sediminihabitans luteus TaxID=1138585 RepID=A0A2M9CDX4_9CELL|nr:SAF domain-containing protein [Sediminihabitans luteus]PJJ70131.1 Flp pilus assembly protein CpaB [Sediminihabitans luteus]GIJ00568.1 hypothetical protein Slu03_29450 [Sediminihabitans luteus]
MTPPSRRAARRLRLLAWRARHVAVALCAALAITQVVHTLAPPPPETRAAVVVAHDLGAGTVLTARDVRVEQLPIAAVPDAAPASVDDVTGRSTAVALVADQVLLPALVGGGELAARGPEGTVVVPVRLQDAGVVALLTPGDHVDLVAPATMLGDPAVAPAPGTSAGGTSSESTSSEGTATGDTATGGTTADAAPYVARRVTVVAVPAGTDDSLLGSGAPQDSLVLVATTPDEAPRVARASGAGGLAAVVVP